MIIRIFIFFWLISSGFSIGQSVDLKKYELKDTTEALKLLKEGDQLAISREFEKAFQKINKSEEIFNAVLGRKAKYTMMCWDFIGFIHYSQQRFEKAKEIFIENLQIKLKVYGEEHLDVAASYMDLGKAYKALGNYEKAIECFNKALKIRENQLEETHFSVATCYHHLGHVYYILGNYNKTIFFFKKKMKIDERIRGSYHLELAKVTNNLGLVFYQQGKYTLSKQYYERSLNIKLKILGDTSYYLASTYGNLGLVYTAQQKNEKAIECLNKALEIKIKAFGPVHNTIATTYNGLGFVYMNQGQYEEANKYFKKALNIELSVFGDTHPIIALRYFNMGNAYAEQREDSLGLIYLEKALQLKLASYEKSHPHISNTFLSIANLYSQSRKYKKAASNYQKCLSGLNFSSLDSLNNDGSIPGLILCLQSMGESYKKQYKESGNLDLLYEAMNRISQANTVLNYRLRLLSPNDKVFRSDLLTGLCSNAISNHVMLYQIRDSLHHLRKAFDYSERTKSYRLYSSIQEADALFFAGLPINVVESEYNLRSNITFYEKQKQEKESNGLSELDTTVLEISNKLFTLNQQYESLKQNLEENYPDYYRLKYDLSTVNVEQVQKTLLNPNQTLVEYFVGDSSIFIYIINQNDYQVQEIKKDFPLEGWVKSFRKANNQNHFKNDIGEYCRVAHDLYQKLVAPVAEHLKDELIIIPDGILGYIPFEALLVEPVAKNKQRLKNHHYFLKDKQISYSYSATLLKQVKEKKHKQQTKKGFLAFAPYYDGDTTLLKELFRYADPEDKKPLKPLPQSGAEVYGLQKIMGGDVYYKEKATENRFTNLAGDYRIIHLATHGRANDKVGDYSYLAFTEQKDSVENELLYVRDLYNLQLNADMVVLSACETGIGELQRGEGIISLARGMTYAGAKSIITSLWSVEDESTRDIMITFYQYLKNGMTKDAALRQAKLDFINDKNNEHSDVHPFYWSGFIGVGDMSPLFFE